MSDNSADAGSLALYECLLPPLKVRQSDTEAGQPTLLDAYANTAVKRQGASGAADAREPADEPPPLPLAMHRLKEKKIMYQRYFALTRLPLETPEQTDELFVSAARHFAKWLPTRAVPTDTESNTRR